MKLFKLRYFSLFLLVWVLQVNVGSSQSLDSLYHDYIEQCDKHIYSNPSLSLYFALKADSVASIIQKPSLIALSKNRLGTSNWSSGNLGKALEYLLMSKSLADSLQDRELSARNTGNIGNIYAAADQNVKAIPFYREALAIHRRDQNKVRMLAMMNNIGKSYTELGVPDSALSYLMQAYGLLDSNLVAYRPILEFNIAEAQFKKKNYTRTLQYLQSCKEAAEQFNDIRALARVAQLRAEISLIEDKITAAQKFGEEAVRFADQTTIKELKYITYQTLSKALGKAGKYKEAFEATRISDAYQDSVQSQKISSILNFYSYQQEQNEIELLEKSRLVQEVQIKQQTFVIGSLAISLVGVFLLLLAINKNRLNKARSNRLLREKNEQILKQNAQIETQAKELQEANLTKDRLFSIISHDLRSPLGTLKSMMELASNESITVEELRPLLPDMSQSVNQTSNLINNLLSWSQSQIGGLEIVLSKFRLFEFLEDQFAFLKDTIREKELEIQIKIDPTLEIISSTSVLSILFRNLLSNATKFTPKHGKVSVEASEEVDSFIILVSDTGEGIPQDKLTQLFSNPVRSHVGTEGEKGSGLGLFLAKEFLDKIDGTITVESELNKGTTFSIRLPKK